MGVIAFEDLVDTVQEMDALADGSPAARGVA
jgi:hypothetical protein